MFGVAPGVTAPDHMPLPALQKNASVRYKSRQASFVSFRDDTRLVAFRYDQTVAAEPPIPIPPPRSSRRPPPRPISCITASLPNRTPQPPPRPAPPTEQHPALRTITTPRSTQDTAKRDSGHAPTVSSHTRTYDEEDSSDEDDDDPFAYEKIDTLPPVPQVLPLRLKGGSISPSIYSEPDLDLRRVSEAGSGISSPLSSPALSDGNTVSPASPVTPPVQFTKRFGRAFSLRSTSSSSSRATGTMKRLRKKSLSGVPSPHTSGTTESGMSGTGRGEGALGSPLILLSALGSAANNSPLPPHPHLHLVHHAHNTRNLDATTATPSGDPHLSPIISTTIPTDSLIEDDFMTQLSFSKRGSIIFGGQRPRTKTKMSAKDNDVPAVAAVKRTREYRAFPLVPPAKKPQTPAGPAQPRQDDRGVHDTNHGTVAQPTDRAVNVNHAQPQTVPDTLSTPRLLPPSIRVISVEAEKESQKVRSLYESGEGLSWEEGGGHSSLGERLEPTGEVPSNEDENDASNGRPGHPTLTSASTVSLQDSTLRRDHELAGGIEDWEGVEGQDVDRYGFISPQRPDSSRPSTATETLSVEFSPRKQRNVLFRKDAAAHSLGNKRTPTRKVSARSLNTQASEYSTASRRSTRSVLRQASNLLPHNKDRRLVDEAGDLLEEQPSLSYIDEDEPSEKAIAELKRKEQERTDKWRRMAKVVKPGDEGQGMIFEFDPKHPKLVQRTWKGIPDCWRAAAWYSFLASSAKASPIPFATDEEIKADFRRLVEQPSPDDAQIDLDVPRTINQHIMFRRRYRGGQRLLFRVLHALSVYFPDTGYVQGMAPLAATFLSYYDEEQCFVMLVRLWKYRGLNRIYQSGFEELMGALKDFETHWLGTKDVAEKLNELCIDPTAYATRWYLTLFNLSIPFAVQLRVWDVFILLGSSPLETPNGVTSSKDVTDHPSSKGLEILHATSLAIIDTLNDRLIDSDFENAMKVLTSWVPIKDEQGFLHIVYLEWKRYQSKQKKKV
ncbi:Uu.00g071230.m01.CDS01 [Anthostomella pinea]|uniref:Uu.00g071230.m01.CDS01 n=1 Tax=Anthostomella pinea TaxID=933095 RepID=A0AAI8VUW0_9PEZI|nr:Uu.00g071230.m01.CDS01 [Anthostomella pinea]